MSDMLVKLYELPDPTSLVNSLRESGVEIRRAIAPEKHVVVQWVREVFKDGWASECEVSFSHLPVSCFIAVENAKIIGFASYDAPCRNFFGPTGVNEDCRGRGIGKALLLVTLQAMAAQGFGYAIIGSAGPTEFYAKAVGAIEIQGSRPGIYKGMLKL